jgi:hypothetical protein
MDIQAIIHGGVNLFVSVLSKELQPNEAAAVAQIVQGVVALVEAQAVNRGGAALLGELAKKYPTLATLIGQVPELKTLMQ